MSSVAFPSKYNGGLNTFFFFIKFYFQSLQNEKTKMFETKKNKVYEDQRVYQDEVVKLKNQYQAILKNMKDTVKIRK